MINLQYVSYYNGGTRVWIKHFPRRLHFKAPNEFANITDLGKLASVERIRSIPLFENLKADGIQPDGDEQFSMDENGIVQNGGSALPVGLDFQLLSVNSGMFSIE